jgi:hypothetical protein
VTSLPPLLRFRRQRRAALMNAFLPALLTQM